MKSPLGVAGCGCMIAFVAIFVVTASGVAIDTESGPNFGALAIFLLAAIAAAIWCLNKPGLQYIGLVFLFLMVILLCVFTLFPSWSGCWALHNNGYSCEGL